MTMTNLFTSSLLPQVPDTLTTRDVDRAHTSMMAATHACGESTLFEASTAPETCGMLDLSRVARASSYSPLFSPTASQQPPLASSLQTSVIGGYHLRRRPRYRIGRSTIDRLCDRFNKISIAEDEVERLVNNMRALQISSNDSYDQDVINSLIQKFEFLSVSSSRRNTAPFFTQFNSLVASDDPSVSEWAQDSIPTFEGLFESMDIDDSDGDVVMSPIGDSLEEVLDDDSSIFDSMDSDDGDSPEMNYDRQSEFGNVMVSMHVDNLVNGVVMPPIGGDAVVLDMMDIEQSDDDDLLHSDCDSVDSDNDEIPYDRHTEFRSVVVSIYADNFDNDVVMPPISGHAEEADTMHIDSLDVDSLRRRLAGDSPRQTHF